MSGTVASMRGACTSYIQGRWVPARGADQIPVENPSTGQTIGQVEAASVDQVDQAVQAAVAAFPDWRRTPVPERTGYLFELRSQLLDNSDWIARTIVEEMGKPLVDARAEMKRAIQNVEAAAGMAIHQHGDRMTGSSSGIDGEVMRLPLGAFGAITPFNFPAMAPFWFLPYALATGNTLVLKPSEQTPYAMARITELLDGIRLPPGVFNLLNGDARTAKALAEHPGLAGLSLVGRSSTCREVASRCAGANKRFQAMGGAKNHLVVMPDARDVDALIANLLTSCFGCAGQRCMAASVIVAVGKDSGRRLVSALVEIAGQLRVADPLGEDAESCTGLVGPVISAQAKAFIYRMIESGVAEGATLVLDGRSVSVPGCPDGHYVGPTIFTDVTTEMEIYRTEIFGPVICCMEVATLDDAIGLINRHAYANAASIYSDSGRTVRAFKEEAQVGMIGVNVGIPAPVPFLPFGGKRDSMHGDIKMQGLAAMRFFTEEKVVVERF